MHYRNGREARNGDPVVKLSDVWDPETGKTNGGIVTAFGILHHAVAGNDHCNGGIAPITTDQGACLCDMLHVDDVAALLAEKGLDNAPRRKVNMTTLLLALTLCLPGIRYNIVLAGEAEKAALLKPANEPTDCPPAVDEDMPEIPPVPCAVKADPAPVVPSDPLDALYAASKAADATLAQSTSAEAIEAQRHADATAARIAAQKDSDAKQKAFLDAWQAKHPPAPQPTPEPNPPAPVPPTPAPVPPTPPPPVVKPTVTLITVPASCQACAWTDKYTTPFAKATYGDQFKQLDGNDPAATTLYPLNVVPRWFLKRGDGSTDTHVGAMTTTELQAWVTGPAKGK